MRRLASGILSVLCLLACGHQTHAREAAPDQTEAAVVTLSRFSSNPSPEGFVAAFGDLREGREIESGWFRVDRKVVGDGFSCRAMIVSSSGSMAGWGYHCWPGKKALPDAVSQRLKGDWFLTDYGRREFGTLMDTRANRGSLEGEPEEVQTAFNYLDSPLYTIPGLEIGRACSQAVVAPRAVRDLRLLVNGNSTQAIERLLWTLNPEGRALAAAWVRNNPDRMSRAATERADAVLGSPIRVMIRECGKFDSASMPVPIKDAHAALFDAVR